MSEFVKKSLRRICLLSFICSIPILFFNMNLTVSLLTGALIGGLSLIMLSKPFAPIFRYTVSSALIGASIITGLSPLGLVAGFILLPISVAWEGIKEVG